MSALPVMLATHKKKINTVNTMNIPMMHSCSLFSVAFFLLAKLVSFKAVSCFAISSISLPASPVLLACADLCGPVRRPAHDPGEPVPHL